MNYKISYTYKFVIAIFTLCKWIHISTSCFLCYTNLRVGDLLYSITQNIFDNSLFWNQLSTGCLETPIIKWSIVFAIRLLNSNKFKMLASYLQNTPVIMGGNENNLNVTLLLSQGIMNRKYLRNRLQHCHNRLYWSILKTFIYQRFLEKCTFLS